MIILETKDLKNTAGTARRWFVRWMAGIFRSKPEVLRQSRQNEQLQENQRCTSCLAADRHVREVIVDGEKIFGR